MSYPFKSLDGHITFDKMVMGKRTVDYHKDGMSTIGQLPEYLEEMRLNGATDDDMAALFRSAEGYIRTWERSTQRAAAIHTTLPPQQKPVMPICAFENDCAFNHSMAPCVSPITCSLLAVPTISRIAFMSVIGAGSPARSK